MAYVDQYNDMTLRNLSGMYENTVRDKLAGKIMLSSFPTGNFHPGEMISQLIGTASHAFPSDSPVMVKIVKVSAKPMGATPEDAVMDAIMNAHMSDSRKMFKEIGHCPENIGFREAMGDNVPCVLQSEGMFPVNNPLQALLSFIFAHGQHIPAEVMGRFDGPMTRMFGPKTYKKMQDIVIDAPALQMFDDSNEIIDAVPEPDDGMPKVQSFLPRLIYELVKLNAALKGKMDEIVKYVTGLQKNDKFITISDRGIQKNILDGITNAFGDESELRKTTGGRSASDIVFNTKFDKDAPEILKVRDFLIDKSKLESLPYSQGASSFSPQVADAIYTKDKKHIDFKALTELIERLEDLKVDDGERKEINDRVLGPLRLFLEPSDDVVDKIVVLR